MPFCWKAGDVSRASRSDCLESPEHRQAGPPCMEVPVRDWAVICQFRRQSLVGADNLEQPRPCRVCRVATEVGTGELMPVQRRVNVCSVVGVGISPMFTALSLCCPPWLMRLHGVEATDGVAGASPPAHPPSAAAAWVMRLDRWSLRGPSLPEVHSDGSRGDLCHRWWRSQAGSEVQGWDGAVRGGLYRVPEPRVAASYCCRVIHQAPACLRVLSCGEEMSPWLALRHPGLWLPSVSLVAETLPAVWVPLPGGSPGA